MKTIKVTLSRAHKIVERLKLRSTELLAEAESLSQPAPVNLRLLPGNPDAIDRYLDRGVRVMALLAEAEAIQRTGAYVREVIAVENVRRDISEKLSQLEVCNKLLASLKALSGLRLPADMEFSNVPAILAGSKDEEPLGLRLNVLTPQQRAELKTKLSTLQRESVVLSDQIAEANAAPVELTLEDNIAALALGLEG